MLPFLAPMSWSLEGKTLYHNELPVGDCCGFKVSESVSILQLCVLFSQKLFDHTVSLLLHLWIMSIIIIDSKNIPYNVFYYLHQGG